MAKKNLSVQKEYKRELNRIKRLVKSARKKGYRFEVDPLPKEVKTPTTKSVARLQKITPQTIYAKTTYYDPILQQRVSGAEERRLIRSRAAKAAAVTRAKAHYPSYKGDISPTLSTSTSVTSGADNPPSIYTDIAANLSDLISKWQPLERWTHGFDEVKRKDRNTLQRIWENALNNLDKRLLFARLEENADEIMRLAWNILYGNSGNKKDEEYITDLTAFAAILQGSPIDMKQSAELEELNENLLGYESPQ